MIQNFINNKTPLNPSLTLCIPTLNAGHYANDLVNAIESQSLKPDSILIVDSGSTDGSLALFKRLNAKIISIPKADFDHGGTRNKAFQMFFSDYYIFLTQDAIPADQFAFKNLITPLADNQECGAVYGRQLPAKNATPFAEHARVFNYPPGDKPVYKGLNDISQLGIKTVFCSNSFAAYRREAMDQIGYFPEGTLFAEDSLAVARMIELGWLVGYCPSATVFHSHNYSFMQEFCRYFDVGAFHNLNPWLLEKYSSATGEGLKFIASEYDYLNKRNQRFIFLSVFAKNFVRYSAYRLGRIQNHIPYFFKTKMTTNKSFWKNYRVI